MAIVTAKASQLQVRWPPFKRWLESCGPAGGFWNRPWVAKPFCCTGLFAEYQQLSPQTVDGKS